MRKGRKKMKKKSLAIALVKNINGGYGYNVSTTIVKVVKK
jgi:hypothetical protein